MLMFRIAVLGYVALVAAGKWGDLPHPDTRVLQGTWEIVSVERSGVADPASVGLTLELAGREVRFQAALDLPTDLPTLRLQPISEEKMRMMAMS